MPETQPSLAGWDIGRFADKEWSAWGAARGDARAKTLAVADDRYLVLVEAQPGYEGNAHEHAFAEFLYVLDGSLRTQGVELARGDAYGAAPGSVHTDFATETGATYLLLFKL